MLLDTPTTSESGDSENENVGNTDFDKTRQFNLRDRILRSKGGSCVKYIKHSVKINPKANRSHTGVSNTGQPRASISGVENSLSQKKAKAGHNESGRNEFGANLSNTSQVDCITSAVSSASINHFVEPAVVTETKEPTENDIAERTTDEPQANNADISTAKNANDRNQSEDLFDDSLMGLIEHGEPATDFVTNNIPTAENENENQIQGNFIDDLYYLLN